MNRLIVDTGPLVAFLNANDAHHAWAREVLDEVSPPLLTCDAVLSEACFLVRNLAGGSDAVLALLARGILATPFRLEAEVEPVRRLLSRYASVPMSLADACLVRMTELDRTARVLTLDSDFRIYRRNRREVLPLITPKPAARR